MSLRVTTSQVVNQSIFDVNQAYSQLSSAETEVDTGKQLNEPSDNPSGTAQVLGFQQQLSQIAQYGQVLSQANGFLSTTEQSLSSVTTLVNQAQSLATQAANGTSSSENSALAGQIQDIMNQIGTLGNATYAGRYVFGGQLTTTPPFAANGQNFTYNGGTAADGNADLTAQVGAGQSITYNVTGDTTIAPILTTLGKLRDDISTGNVDAISNTDLANITTDSNQLSAAQANVGSTIDQITAEQGQNTQTTTNLTTFVSNIQDANTAQAVVQLQTAQNTYQAALEGTSRIFQYSLLDYLT